MNESRNSFGDFYLECLSKISEKFESNSSNSLFHVEPPKVVMKLGRENLFHHEIIKIINHTARSQKCFVMPLESDLFIIKFNNKESVAPDLFMTVQVSLRPIHPLSPGLAWLKIHCFDDNDLMIPIEAEESKPTIISNIPRLIDFGIVPLCESVSRKIMISPKTQENISNATILEPHIDVMVQVVDGASVNEASYVEVIYRPTSYTTMSTSIMIFTPSFATYFPIVRIIGYCQPPPYKDQLQKFNDNKILFLKQCGDEFAKRAPLLSKNEEAYKGDVHSRKTTQTDYSLKKESVVPWWSQKDFESPKESTELLGPLGNTTEEDEEIKKMNQKMFLQRVDEIKDRSKNVLRRVDTINLGMTGNEEEECNFDMDWMNYVKLRNFPPEEAVLFESDYLLGSKQRIIKHPEKSPKDKVTKDEHCSAWFTRFYPLCRFIQAGRQVIVRNRLAKRLRLLQAYVRELPIEEREEQIESELDNVRRIKFFGSSYVATSEDTPE